MKYLQKIPAVWHALIVLSVLALSACSTVTPNDCLKTRAAFDVGSGTTKMKVATIDTCKGQIIGKAMALDEAVKYKDDLQRPNANNSFSEKIQRNGIDALKKLKSEATRYGASEFYAVATAAFRDACNGQQLADRISQDTGIRIKIASQVAEARLGYEGSRLAVTGISHPVVWDIGGGSMQITFRDAAGNFKVYEGDLASESFRKHVIEAIQRRGTGIKSPNPMSTADKDAALKYAREHARKNVAATMATVVRAAPTIVGIGNVHSKSVLGQVNPKANIFTRDQVRETLEKRYAQNDQQIGGKYAATEIINLILVLGYMQALGIDSVTTAPVNLADGLLLAPAYSR